MHVFLHTEWHVCPTGCLFIPSPLIRSAFHSCGCNCSEVLSSRDHFRGFTQDVTVSVVATISLPMGGKQQQLTSAIMYLHGKKTKQNCKAERIQVFCLYRLLETKEKRADMMLPKVINTVFWITHVVKFKHLFTNV